jgi:hypothetical protein
MRVFRTSGHSLVRLFVREGPLDREILVVLNATLAAEQSSRRNAKLWLRPGANFSTFSFFQLRSELCRRASPANG